MFRMFDLICASAWCNFSKTGIGQRGTPSPALTWSSCWWRLSWTAWRELCCSALGSTCRMRDNSQARGRWLLTTPPSWSLSSSTHSSQSTRRMWHAGTWQVPKLTNSNWKLEIFFPEVTLNSISSVLSYNQFNFGPIFKHGEKAKEEKREEKHQPSFVKQTIKIVFH